MKIFLSLAVMCFALHSGMGAPTKGTYMFVKCHPWGNNSNCVTHQSPEMNLSADLPGRLPASAAQYIGAEPVTVQKQPEVESAMFFTAEGEEGSSGGWSGSGSGDNGTPQEEDSKAQYQPAEEELRADHLLNP